MLLFVLNDNSFFSFFNNSTKHFNIFDIYMTLTATSYFRVTGIGGIKLRRYHLNLNTMN